MRSKLTTTIGMLLAALALAACGGDDNGGGGGGDSGSDLPADTKTGASMQQGGMFILNNLKALVETGKLPFGTRMMYFMFARMEFVLPARSKSGHWPM